MELRVDAIVLAGGASARMGEDKALMLLGGRTLLERVLDASERCRRVVVVGPRRIGIAHLEARVDAWLEEDPPGAGPVHALAAGLARGGAPWTLVLACDLPFVTTETVERLAAGARRDGALLTDGDRDVYVCAIYRTEALATALTSLDDTRGAPLWRVVSSLDLVRIADPDAALDLDTPEDVADARRRFSS